MGPLSMAPFISPSILLSLTSVRLNFIAPLVSGDRTSKTTAFPWTLPVRIGSACSSSLRPILPDTADVCWLNSAFTAVLIFVPLEVSSTSMTPDHFPETSLAQRAHDRQGNNHNFILMNYPLTQRQPESCQRLHISGATASGM